MTAMRLAKRIFFLINKHEDKKISSLVIEREQEIFIQYKDGSKFRVIVMPTAARI